LQYEENKKSFTPYTRQILDELKNEGTVEFLSVLRSKKYDISKAKFTTYIYPFIKGAMYRYMETNIAELSLDELVAKTDGDSNKNEISFEYLMADKNNISADKVVYHTICLELLEDLFMALSEKDKYILGHSYGLFGYKKMTLDEIAFEEELTVDGVIKARKTALRKMKEKYPDSKLCLWRKTYHIIVKN
jgi:RNA polymerase sigma factor (sigma-70 family)